QADQVTDPLMERAIGPGAEQVRHAGRRIADIIINMTELMVRRGKPTAVGLDRHQAPDVVTQVDVPGAGVAVLLAAGPRVGWVEVGLLPEGFRQPGKSERDDLWFRLRHRMIPPRR